MGAPHVVVRNRFRFEPDKFKQWHANELPRLKPVFVQTGVREIYRGGGTIYRIVDPKRNEPCYIGATVNAENRFFDHITDLRKQRHGNLKLQRIYNKRLREGFGELKIETHEAVLFDLGERERYWIALYRKKTNGRLCNIIDGGNAGCTSDESKKKLAEKTRAIWRNPEYAKKCRLGWDAAMAKKLGVSLEQYLSNRVVYRKDAPKPENVALYRERRAMAARRRAEENELKKQMATLTHVTHKGVAFVPCTNGKWAKIDAVDADSVIKHKWHANQKGSGKYSARTTVNSDKLTLGVYLTATKTNSSRVSYVDGNPMNCCRSNLRTRHHGMGAA
jgi:hypothetical protein